MLQYGCARFHESLRCHVIDLYKFARDFKESLISQFYRNMDIVTLYVLLAKQFGIIAFLTHLFQFCVCVRMFCVALITTKVSGTFAVLVHRLQAVFYAFGVQTLVNWILVRKKAVS